MGTGVASFSVGLFGSSQNRAELSRSVFSLAEIRRAMSLSPKTSEEHKQSGEQASSSLDNQPLEKLLAGLEQTNKLLEHIVVTSDRTLHALNTLDHKASCAEMRQCQLSGEGTDASRMTALYLTGESALWTAQTKHTIVEMLYKGGNVRAIEYQGLFQAKDERRIQWLVSIFYETFVKDSGEFFDMQGQEHNKFAGLLPAFRVEMLEKARRTDSEMGIEQIGNLPFGSYEERVVEALGELPTVVQHLTDLVLPVNKQFEPVLTARSEPSEATNIDPEAVLELLPRKVTKWIEWCTDSMDFHNQGIREKTTRSIVYWYFHMIELNKIHKQIKRKEHLETKAKWNESGEKVKYEKTLEMHMEQIKTYCKGNFPKHAELLKKHAEVCGEAAP